MDIKRTLEEVIKKDSSNFKILLLTGPRQVGKTTLLRNIQKEERHYVTLDDLNMRKLATEDPASFIGRLQLPVLIDEVQYAPNLFPYIKIAVDNSQERGLFWMTGSHQFDMMKNVTESLAGRVGILKLQGISLAEEEERIDSSAFLPEIENLNFRRQAVKSLNKNNLTIREIYHKIWRGSFPDIVSNKNDNWERFYESYVSTYIQIDIQHYLKIKDQSLFYKFMQVAASYSGQIINYASISKSLEISQPTVKNWISALQTSGIVYLLQPYSNNKNKRLIKTPKIYFMDTGLCSFLSGWLNEDVLERGAMSGAILETYVVSEIIKSYIHNGINPHIYFYRDKEKNEIDLLIERNNKIYPIEIKKTASIANLKSNYFDILEKLNINIGHGAVICFVNDILPLTEKIDAVPICYV